MKIDQFGLASPQYKTISQSMADAELTDAEARRFLFTLLGYCNHNDRALNGFKKILKEILKDRK